MVNSEELLYVVDEFNEKIKPEPRHKVFKNGLWRRTTHVWILNKKKKVLCQRRSLKKDSFPGMWEPCIAGHLGPDDNFFTGAVREASEETGLSLKTSDLNLLKIYKDSAKKAYTAVFYCELDVEAHHVKSEEDEVDSIKMVNLKTLKHNLLYKKSNSWMQNSYAKEMFDVLSKHSMTL